MVKHLHRLSRGLTRLFTDEGVGAAAELVRAGASLAG
jgi:hypothetical protein